MPYGMCSRTQPRATQCHMASQHPQQPRCKQNQSCRGKGAYHNAPSLGTQTRPHTAPCLSTPCTPNACAGFHTCTEFQTPKPACRCLDPLEAPSSV